MSMQQDDLEKSMARIKKISRMEVLLQKVLDEIGWNLTEKLRDAIEDELEGRK